MVIESQKEEIKDKKVQINDIIIISDSEGELEGAVKVSLIDKFFMIPITTFSIGELEENDVEKKKIVLEKKRS